MGVKTGNTEGECRQLEFQPKLDRGSKLSLLLKGLSDFQPYSF